MKDLLIWGSFLSFTIAAAIFFYTFMDDGLDEAIDLFTTRYRGDPGTEFRASLTIFLIFGAAQWMMFKEITIFPWSKKSQESEPEG